MEGINTYMVTNTYIKGHFTSEELTTVMPLLGRIEIMLFLSLESRNYNTCSWFKMKKEKPNPKTPPNMALCLSFMGEKSSGVLATAC